MADQVRLSATLVIDPQEIVKLLREAMPAPTWVPTTNTLPTTSQELPLGHDDRGTKKSHRRVGRPKGSRAKKPEEVNFRINGMDSAELQAKSVIIQAAMHTHGDAKAREIMLSWTDEDTAAIATMKKIFPDVTLEALGQAVMDAEAAEITGLPRVWMATVFTRANGYTKGPAGGEEPDEDEDQEEGEGEEEDEPETDAKTTCDICGSSGAHAQGCPRGFVTASEDGGAIASRVPTTRGNHQADAQAPAAPEPCGLGGPPACPLPHATVFQGGAHIAVHAPEVAAQLRAALGGATPVARWNAPPPPENAPQVAKKRGGWPRGKPRKKKGR